jgi:hypothetical protein
LSVNDVSDAHHVLCRRTLKPLSSHEVAISTSVTAANARKRLPPMYAIICTNEDSAGRTVENGWCITVFISKLTVQFFGTHK